MTDKDQAIALVLEAEHRARSCGFVSGTTNWAGVIVNVLNAQPPAPDCRTCDMEKAVLKGRATWCCAKCGRDFSIEYLLWAEAAHPEWFKEPTT